MGTNPISYSLLLTPYSLLLKTAINTAESNYAR
jgi:hypothetical protein